MGSNLATALKLWCWKENNQVFGFKRAALSGPLFCAQSPSNLLHNNIHQLAKNEYLFHDLLPTNG
jgi:hypothetical protein